MHKFVRNLLTEWRKLELPFANETIIIAVSGGADSVSLALALHNLKTHKKINNHFIIAHFNHNLRGIESEKDEQFVKDLSQKLDFEFISKVQDSNFKLENQKGNLEQNARIARYNFLNEIAQQHNAYAILTAHTQNDQAETLLINLIRGSGLDGLAGMSAVRNNKKQISETLLVRPLLSWAKRKDTENYCTENNFNFRHDKMNDDLKFLRVQIRKEIIPQLEKINPKVVETLSQTAKLLRQDAEELNKISYNLAENVTQKSLKGLSKSMRLRVLRHWLEFHRSNLREIDLKHLEAIESIIFSPKSGRIVELPNGEKVVKKDGKIFFEKTGVEKS